MIPNPANPQDYNRFSYVRNNPARYTDPSGHIACIDGEYCGKPPKPTTQYWERLIKKKFGVTLSGDWSMKNTSIMYFAMTNYDEAIGGNLSKFTSGLTFSFSYDAYHYGGLTSHNGNIAFHGNTLPYQNIYHELSHSIDYVSGGFFTTHLDRITVQTNNGDYVMGGPNYQRNGFGYNQTRVSDPNFLNGIEAEQHSNRTHCDRVGWCENGNTANEEWADLVANYVSGNFSDTGPFADYGITRKNWVQSIFIRPLA